MKEVLDFSPRMFRKANKLDGFGHRRDSVAQTLVQVSDFCERSAADDLDTRKRHKQPANLKRISAECAHA